jgi:hypothetical protein
MTAQDSPNEIYIKVFRYLGKKDLLCCSLVCKSWSTPAIQTLHTTVQLNGRGVNFLQLKLSQQEKQEHPFYQHGHWVKTLRIWLDEPDPDDDMDCSSIHLEEAEFRNLIYYLPNLKKIDITGSFYSTFYLQALQNTNSSEYLQKMEEIVVQKIISSREYRDLAFSARLNFCQSLTHLDIFFENQTITSDSGESGDGLFFLPRFTNLTHLEIQNHQYPHLTVFQLLEMVPTLVDLKFQNNFSDSANDVNNGSLLLGTEKNMIERKKSLPIQLESLALALPRLTKPSLRCFLSYLFDHLKSFKIYMNSVTFYDWVRDIGVDEALEFAETLNQINNVELAFEPIPGNDQQQAQQQNSNEFRANTFYKFLHALIGNRTLSNCSTTYYGGEIRQETPFISIKNSSSLSFRDGLDFNSGSNSYRLPTPKIKYTKIGPEIITNARLLLATGAESSTTRVQILQSILGKCLNLEELFVYCCITDFKLKATSDDSTRQQERRLTKVKLIGSALTQPLIDALCTHQPNIKVIICTAQHIGPDFDVDLLQDDITLDLTGYRNLHNFTYNIKNAIAGEFDHLFIHFIINIYSNNSSSSSSKSQQQHYYYDIRPLGIRKRPFSCTSTFTGFINQRREDESVKIKSITVHCNEITDFVLFTGSSLPTAIAEFHAGALQAKTPAKFEYFLHLHC